MKNETDSLSIGRAVISREAEGLHLLEQSLGPAFEQAVQTILSGEGHLIVVGLGKSGHIGRKIAASFASTGTPAFFLHPTEAAHGDLGMIRPESVVLGLSNSGESHEVNGVIAFAKNNGNQTLAVTGVASSTLPKNLPLVTKDISMPELILAMTSGGKGCVGVTDAGALIGIVTDGDLRRAMSHDIMEKSASDIMTSGPFTLTGDVRMKDAIAALSQRKIGNAFVLEDGNIIGLLDLKTLLAIGNI